jgi:phosphoglycolate phosphatase
MKTVVFDLDGTLADTSGFRDMGAGDLLDARHDAGTALKGGRAMLRLGMERLGRAEDEATIDRYYPVLLKAYAQDIDTHTVLYPGAMDAVEALKIAGYRVAICTNKPEGLAHILLTRLGIRDAFGAMLGADSLAVRKPDTNTDRKTAAAAGVPCILVTFGPSGEDMAALNPEALLHDYAHLPALVPTLIGGI